MAVTVVVGTQWGDEGKGKTVDVLASTMDAVVRYQGGNNAGHTLVVDGEKTVLHLIPSGVMYPEVDCFLARGVVLHPQTFLDEIEALLAKGVDVEGRLFVSRRTPLIMPWHVEVDALREQSKGSIGTTKKGIGPCYEQFVARQSVLAGDLLDVDVAVEKIEHFYGERHALMESLRGEEASGMSTADAVEAAVTQFLDDFEAIYGKLVPYIVDVESALQDRIRRGQQILMEGAQGTFLDIGMGTYPFVTSSHTTAAGACTGAGIAPRDIDEVIGICKAYTTRVGDGPFPTELDSQSEVGAHLQDKGREFGATTGRPRRCGWLDLVVLREAIQLNGCDGITLTKLDVLSGLEELLIATSYDADGKPVYERFPGWNQEITDARSLDDLPQAAVDYVRWIEEAIGEYRSTIEFISVGPGREQIFAPDFSG